MTKNNQDWEYKYFESNGQAYKRGKMLMLRNCLKVGLLSLFVGLIAGATLMMQYMANNALTAKEFKCKQENNQLIAQVAELHSKNLVLIDTVLGRKATLMNLSTAKQSD
jgi:hypothetical protein